MNFTTLTINGNPTNPTPISNLPTGIYYVNEIHNNVDNYGYITIYNKTCKLVKGSIVIIGKNSQEGVTEEYPNNYYIVDFSGGNVNQGIRYIGYNFDDSIVTTGLKDIVLTPQMIDKFNTCINELMTIYIPSFSIEFGNIAERIDNIVSKNNLEE